MNACPLCQSQNEHILFNTPNYRIIAVTDEPNTPAFCRVIWQQHRAEMTDLNPQQRQELMNAIYQVEAGMRQILKPTKINLASLGNIVPHLHWHIIARFNDDIYFPAPIWSVPQKDTSNLTLPHNWLTQLKEYLKQHLVN